MKIEETRAFIEAVLRSRAASESPVARSAAVALQGHIEELAEALTSGTANLHYMAVFSALKAQIDSIHATLNAEYLQARDAASNAHWMQCMDTAASLPQRTSWEGAGDFDRTVPKYDSDAEIQAAYAAMCAATFKIGDLLLRHPPGTFVYGPQGSYFLSATKGALKLLLVLGSEPVPAEVNTGSPIWCDGIGAQELHEIAKNVEIMLKNPDLRILKEPLLLDALALYSL